MGARNRVVSLNCFPIIGLLLLLAVVTAAATTIFHFSQVQQGASQRSLPLNPIQQENQRPGTSSWEPTSPANLAPYDPKTFRTPAIEGYAWATSVQAGEMLRFSVSTTATSFTAVVYRLGWYRGRGGRLITSVARLPGHFYPVSAPDPSTGP